jgi:hypothetical protein
MAGLNFSDFFENFSDLRIFVDKIELRYKKAILQPTTIKP